MIRVGDPFCSAQYIQYAADVQSKVESDAMVIVANAGGDTNGRNSKAIALNKLK